MKKIVRRSGFTLPEILVTVTVVAVLAAVVVPAVTQYVNKGNGPASQTDFAQIQNAITGYVADTRVFPGHLSALTASTAQYGESNFHGPYLSATIASGVTGATATTQSAFTSSGLGLQFADSIANSGGYLSLFVSTSTPCTSLLALDSLIDNKNGASSGRVTWTDGGTACAPSTPAGTFTTASFQLMPSGT